MASDQAPSGSGGYGFSHDFVQEGKKSFADIYDAHEKKVIGEGSYGKVFLAKDRATGMEHAVKEISCTKITPAAKARLDMEIEILRKLDHPNIVKLYNFTREADNMYLCQENCVGGELFDRIIDAAEVSSEGMAFDEQKASTYMNQIIGAMCYLHSKSYAHRDIKPENFLMEHKGLDAQIKVIDFGLGKKFEKGVPMKTKAGTPFYVAPQVLQGKYDEKCDVWSCGVICYILLSGVPPFYGDNDSQILSAVRAGKYEYSTEWDGISQSGKEMIDLMLQMDPNKRPSFETLSSNKWLENHADKGGSKLHPTLSTRLSKFCKYNKFKKLALTAVAVQLPDEKIQNLKQSFQALDKNKDGSLTIAEIVDGLSQNDCLNIETKEFLKKHATELDTDGSGSIDYSEFIAATIEKSSLTSNACIKAAFNTMDADGDGFISAAELKRHLAQEPEEMLKQMIQQHDLDGDGRISLDEFTAMVTKDK